MKTQPVGAKMATKRWFNTLTSLQQKAYLKRHPNSSFGPGGRRPSHHLPTVRFKHPEQKKAEFGHRKALRALLTKIRDEIAVLKTPRMLKRLDTQVKLTRLRKKRTAIRAALAAALENRK